ncbi:vacuolar-processing enzyme beta-isozyme-like [Rutidosis leptorrhynchoides]|uniref:vacuolar-processing enzyme beta-isozyme-like n=1 Tax=Rutidosis leptorrhynchoides TaxID=125765 RepID=UPI003A994394
MYDDIANNTLNPRPGVIINSPDGDDVYKGVPKDYTGDDVTADNFYAVLLGNASGVTGGGGKVLSSEPQDTIFVYYSDHGGRGVLEMPTRPNVYANDFINALKVKHAMGTYNEMVIYIESCLSGSIFEGLLPEDLNIYVTTASNATERSWATYCPRTDPPSPPGFNTCLGDMYSVSWLEDSDYEDLDEETLEEQYLKTKTRTLNNKDHKGSHVMQYGTQIISIETVSVYLGSYIWKRNSNPFQSFESMGVVNQRDADVYSMWHQYKSLTENSQEKEELLKKIKRITSHRAHLDNSIDIIRGKLLQGEIAVRPSGMAIVDDWDCLKTMVRTYETHCGSLTHYGMLHTLFADLCNNNISKEAMDEAAKATCSSYDMGQWDPAIVGYSA